ncbi:MAG TPA: helix-turn-helix domain-containing protein [Methylococcaceae bacterium]|nr:helix-turn-helix domain-containing protein [Methylococcaceae bacterium]
MRTAGGKINGPSGAAQLLGLHPNTLRKRMNKLGIPYGRKSWQPQVVKNQ